MQLSASQITQYERDGFLFFPGLLDSDEVALLQGAMPSILSRSGNEIIREKEDPTSVRLALGHTVTQNRFGVCRYCHELLSQ